MVEHRQTNTPENEFSEMFSKLESSGELDLEAAKVEIAEQIYLAMEQHKISRANLAERLGNSRAYVTKILQGTANFTLESLTKIAHCLDCELQLKMIPRYQITSKFEATIQPSLNLLQSPLTSSQYSFQVESLISGPLVEPAEKENGNEAFSAAA